MKYAIGIDIGGTNTRVALVNENHEVIERQQFRTDADHPANTVAAIKEVTDSFDVEIVGMGVSCPGPLDLINGIVLDTPNLHGEWHGFPIAEELTKATGHKTYLQNDANLAALAEAVVGEGKDYRFVQFLTVSTGVGAGFTIDKKIYIGAHGFAQEIAWMCLWKNGPHHGEIYPGGIEGIASGTAITTRAKAAGLDVGHAGHVNDLALQGNLSAMQIMDDAKEYLANGIAAIIEVLDPDIIILGGSVSLKTEGFVEEVEERVKTKVFPCVRPYVKIRRSTLGEDSGLLGAACLAFENA